MAEMSHFFIMKIKERTLASFTQNSTRLQLVMVQQQMVRYQVRLNRKVVHKSISEYTERKVFASYCQNIVLQLKIY